MKQKECPSHRLCATSIPRSCPCGCNRSCPAPKVETATTFGVWATAPSWKAASPRGCSCGPTRPTTAPFNRTNPCPSPSTGRPSPTRMPLGCKTKAAVAVYHDNPHYVAYVQDLLRLRRMMADSSEETPEEEAVRERTGAAWPHLSPAERARVRGLSADLYMLTN